MVNGKLGRQIFYTASFSIGSLKLKSIEGNPQTVTELKEAIGKEMTSIGSEVTKAIIDSVKKKAQYCIQSGGHLLKKIVIEN